MADIQLLPVDSEQMAEPTEPITEPATTPIETPVPVARGRGIPPGARNKPKAPAEAPVVDAPAPKAKKRSAPEPVPEETEEEPPRPRKRTEPPPAAPTPMTPLELSHQLRLIATEQRDQKREYYAKMLAHLL